MTADTPDTPEEKSAEKAKTEEPPVPEKTPEMVAEQPEPAKPTGLAAIAEAVKATAASPLTGKEAGGEGKGLFFPNADKIRERERARKEASSDTPLATVPAEAAPQPDTPTVADKPADGEERAPEPERAEEEVTVHRPPPPPTPEAKPPTQPSPKTAKKKSSIGGTGIIAYMAPYKAENGETRFQIVTYNLSPTDSKKIEWMCHYLCDVQHYIPVAHPSYLMKFMFNFLMQAIKEEFYEGEQRQ